MHRVLTRCVHKVCPPSLRSVADDIAQTAAARLFARMKAAQDPLDLNSSYLWRVANHAVIDEIRRHQRGREEASERSDEVAAATGDPLVAQRRARIVEGVRDCLANATPQRRAALGLHLQGLQLPEVAVALGCNRKRADNLVYRGLVALRACLQTKGLRP